MTLVLEQLEPRNLVALAAFGVGLYADEDGVPGPAIDAVEVGDMFFVEITAESLLPTAHGPHGLHGISVDLAWDADAVTVVEPWDVSEVVTDKLPGYQFGVLDNDAGRIDDLGGSAIMSAGGLVGLDGPEQFALLHFEAQREAEASPFVVRGGFSNISFSPRIMTHEADFYFEPQVITVVATDPFERTDVDESGRTDILDALVLVVDLVEHGAHAEIGPLDVNGDGNVTTLDLLEVIREIADRG